jgi:branched-chain amino acid transport system ATP-binding protein
MEQNKGSIILEGINLDLNFGGIKSLEKVNFQVRRGEILSIIGPNGAGKTCLLNCITGYYRPENGRIVFQDRDIMNLPPHKISQTGIARTFQNPSLYANLTALDNLLVARYVHTKANIIDSLLYFGRSRREEIESRKSVEEIISFAQIQDLRNRPVSMLSFGQRKLVEIGRALVMQPKIVLLDEPMSGLDDILKEIVAELILKIQRKGMTVVLVEHDMEVVMGLSQSIIVLNFGHKIAEGSPEDILHNESVIEAYLGTSQQMKVAAAPK